MQNLKLETVSENSLHENGILLVNKPAGPTSHDVVDRVRAVSGMRQIGHAGTLDPLARGLVIILVGETTKRAKEFSDLPKTYEALLRLGIESNTDDIAGTLQQRPDAAKPSFDAVASALAQFRGTIKQTPPQFSAVKTKGKKAYEEARKGKTVAIPPREITVYKLEIIHYQYPLLALTMDVSSGTYVRAIARDLGSALGTGAVVASLTRTHIGNFRLNDTVPLRDLTKENWRNKIWP